MAMEAIPEAITVQTTPVIRSSCPSTERIPRIIVRLATMEHLLLSAITVLETTSSKTKTYFESHFLVMQKEP